MNKRPNPPPRLTLVRCVGTSAMHEARLIGLPSRAAKRIGRDAASLAMTRTSRGVAISRASAPVYHLHMPYWIGDGPEAA